MTTRKKKPFWTKLLSALLIACMLVGTVGTSSLAAAGDPGNVTEADAVSSDSSNGDEETTPAADTTNTDVTPSDKADPSAPKTNLPEGAGDNALLNANGTQTGTSGEGTGGQLPVRRAHLIQTRDRKILWRRGIVGRMRLILRKRRKKLHRHMPQ